MSKRKWMKSLTTKAERENRYRKEKKKNKDLKSNLVEEILKTMLKKQCG